MELRKALVVVVWRKSAAEAEKKVLVLRLIPRRGAYWQPVTGKVEDGETFAEGALREATEETGLRFDCRPQYLGMESTFPGRDGYTVREQCFCLVVLGGDEPPAPKLDGHEHDAFEWLSPDDAGGRVKWPGNRAAIERACTASPLFLSARGIFFQDGEEVTHARTVELLHRSLAQTGALWQVKIGDEALEVVVEDTPRFVVSYERKAGELSLSDGSKEKLRPETLRVRKDNGFTCVLGNGWTALFLSAAYYEISKDVCESPLGRFELTFLGKKIPLSS